MRTLTQLTGQQVLRTWTPSSTSGTSWINAFGGFRTHPGHSRSSPTPWLRSGRILILGQSIGLSDACPGVVDCAFRHVGVIPAINVSFQYDWMNVRKCGTNPYLDYHFIFYIISGISRQIVIPHSPRPIALSFAPDSLRHLSKQKFSNLKLSSSSYAMISKGSPNCFEQCI